MALATTQRINKQVKLSYRDYVLLPNDGKRHEIIDGEHFMTPSPVTKHQRISRKLEWIIESFLKKNPVGEIFYAPYDVILSETNIVVPDLVYISKENSKIITEDNIQGSPDLIVEILSPTNRNYDKVLKKDLYEAFGVKEYWIIDPEEEIVEVYRLSANNHRFSDPGIYKKNQCLKTDLIPALEIDLKEVFS